MADQFKRATTESCGIGGWHCPCCGPVDTEDKRKARRRARRVMKQRDRKRN